MKKFNVELQVYWNKYLDDELYKLDEIDDVELDGNPCNELCIYPSMTTQNNDDDDDALST